MEEEGKFKNFTFENFSIVTNPAVKKAYINLSQKNLKGGNMINKLEDSEDDKEDKDEDEVEEDAEDKKEPKEDPEEVKKKDKKKMPPEEEMSAEEILEVSTNSEWPGFVSKMRSKYSKMSVSDIAKAFKSKSKEDSELEELSETDLVAKIEKLTNILARKKKYPMPDAECKQVKENTVIKEMSQKIAEMEKRLNEPDAKSIVSRELSNKTSMTAPHTSGVQAFAEYLQNEFLK
jgi:hypothetical protein